MGVETSRGCRKPPDPPYSDEAQDDADSFEQLHLKGLHHAIASAVASNPLATLAGKPFDPAQPIALEASSVVSRHCYMHFTKSDLAAAPPEYASRAIKGEVSPTSWTATPMI